MLWCIIAALIINCAPFQPNTTKTTLEKHLSIKIQSYQYLEMYVTYCIVHYPD